MLTYVRNRAAAGYFLPQTPYTNMSKGRLFPFSLQPIYVQSLKTVRCKFFNTANTLCEYAKKQNTVRYFKTDSAMSYSSVS